MSIPPHALGPPTGGVGGPARVSSGSPVAQGARARDRHELSWTPRRELAGVHHAAGFLVVVELGDSRARRCAGAPSR
ncbi:hypothetical protein QJS66_21570 [Kocuria rhizophila]|nr:hypothetical protein QJS66_21570 [Kocuria rhizophila]